MEQLKRDFDRQITTLQADGSLGQAFPTVCADDQNCVEPDPDGLRADRIGIEGR